MERERKKGRKFHAEYLLFVHEIEVLKWKRKKLNQR
jgi:hypothetical protein